MDANYKRQLEIYKEELKLSMAEVAEDISHAEKVISIQRKKIELLTDQLNSYRQSMRETKERLKE